MFGCQPERGVMTGEEQYRFEMLRQGPCAPPEYFAGYYGFGWPLPDDVRADYEAWLNQLKRRHGCSDGRGSRYELESFMQQKGVVPKKWMGARLGMQVGSFNELLARLADIG